MPDAGCHLSHCLADLLDCRTRCILFCTPADPLGWVLVRHSHILSIYRNIHGGFHKCFHNISVHITFKLMRLFQGLFVCPEAQIISPDELKLMNWICNDCTSLLAIEDCKPIQLHVSRNSCKYYNKCPYQLVIFNQFTSYLIILISLKKLTKRNIVSWHLRCPKSVFMYLSLNKSCVWLYIREKVPIYHF